MLEYWLQKFIRANYAEIGFTSLHGPYHSGADFKGVYAGQPVKIEAEWDYADYIAHKHSLRFADVLVVATIDPVPPNLKEKLPPIILNLDRACVVEWAQPRSLKKEREDYYAYPWRRLAQNLLYLYAWYRRDHQAGIDFAGSRLAPALPAAQKPLGFRFGTGGREEGFEGRLEDKAVWDYWLEVAHAVADHFRLKPALLHPTWIDRIALYFANTGRITEGEARRFKDVGRFIDDLILENPG